MAGILNKKERMLDTIVTLEGRRQAAQGQLKIAYATFTDRHTFYQASGSNNVAEPADTRLFFEATSRFQDVVVPELEPGNSMRPFKTRDFIVDGKNIASGTFKVGFMQRATVLSGSRIMQASSSLPDQIATNFTDHRILATEDPFSDTTGFSTATATKDFSVNNTTRFPSAPQGPGPHGANIPHASADSSPSLFRDKRFAHFPNFDYLPPVNMPTSERTLGEPLANYVNLSEPADQSFEDIMNSVKGRASCEIRFTDTSRDNNLVAQVFEFSRDGVEKLSLVDAGEFEDGDPLSPGKHVYYAGKIIRDSTGAETFFNIFTIVFD